MNKNKPMSDPALERTWQQTIDRLVDGELSDADSRQLLAMLDGVEGGWRRLALAYVEAQWLRGDLASLPGTALPVPAPALHFAEENTSSVARKPSRAVRLTLMTLAVAASMLVAFVVSLRRNNQDGPATNLSPPEVGIPLAGAPGSRSVENQGGVPQHRAEPDGGANAVAAGLNHAVASVAQPRDGMEPQWVVIGSDPVDSQPVAVPPRVIDALRRSGHRVDQRSGVMPVRLQDGRKVNVPYDQLDVQYGGAASFQ
jgi:hypothetical protein